MLRKRFLVVVMLVLLFGGSKAYAADIATEQKKADYIEYADDFIEKAKESENEISQEIKEQVKEKSKEMVKDAKDSLKSTVKKSFQEYFSIFFQRMKEFSSRLMENISEKWVKEIGVSNKKGDGSRLGRCNGAGVSCFYEV